MCVSVGQGPFSKKKMMISWLGMELRVEGPCVQGLKGGRALPGKSLKQRLTRQGRGLVLEYSRFSSMMMFLSNSLAHYSASETTASWASASELPPYVWCVNALLQKFTVLTQDLLNVERKSHCTPETLFSSSWVTVEIFPSCPPVLKGAKNNIYPQRRGVPWASIRLDSALMWQALSPFLLGWSPGACFKPHLFPCPQSHLLRARRVNSVRARVSVSDHAWH